MTNHQAYITKIFREHITLAERVLAEQSGTINAMANIIIECYQAGRKAIFCGNGGSAADAQHLAAEFVGRYLIDRRPLPALALHTDTSTLTAIGNDYGYDQVFSRQVNAHIQPGDVLVCLTTSGNSRNVVLAAETARAKGNTVLGLLGRDGGAMLPLCDHALVVPCQETYLIQEVSMLVGHLLCDLMEQALFGNR
ncbi:MAG TPA: D-sedoheptulose 7-phosphate isomerase [Herpetosiphonaceae bacterium]|nr:D-sedoheptulose 7-phosphate isomerase [Herpetosiphonaceae bacterium]